MDERARRVQIWLISEAATCRKPSFARRVRGGAGPLSDAVYRTSVKPKLRPDRVDIRLSLFFLAFPPAHFLRARGDRNVCY